MKVVIPVAGVGTRLRPHTHAIPKVLMRTAGKTILEHIIDDILPLKPDEIIFIIGYLGDKIKDFAKGKYKNVKTTFITQKEYNGLGAAIYLANEKVSPDEELVIILGDTLIRGNLKKFIKLGDNVIAVKSVDNPSKFGVIETTKQGTIAKFIEKPEIPPSDMAVVGLYYLKKAQTLFSALKYVIDNDIKTKGEYQLTDALQYMLEQGSLFKYFMIEKWLDCGNKENLLKTNRELLDEKGSYKKGNIQNSVIINPVFIHKNAKVQNSVIGPYASISEHTIIQDSIVRNSIICEKANIQSAMLSDSLISDNAFVRDAFRHVNIGSHAELDIK